MSLRRALDTLGSSGAIFVCALIAGAACGLALSFGAPAHTVSARFTNVNGLVTGNEVRVAGVQVGTVQSLAIVVDPATGAQQAAVTFSVDAAHWPLHQGTRAAVRPKGVLSNVYVDLEPASPASPSLGDAPRLDTTATSSPVNLDELSNVFDPSVRTAIRTQLQEGVLALGGSGPGDLNDTLHNAGPLLGTAIPVTDVLAARSPQLDRLNGEFATLSGDLARENANLRGLIVNGDVLLGALATKQVQLQQTLVHAQGTLTTLDAGLQGSEADLRRFLHEGPAALAAARSAADLLTPLIAAVNPHIPSLDTLLYEMMTATGYNLGTPNDAYGRPIDTLRVDGTLPPSSHTATGCGGTNRNPC